MTDTKYARNLALLASIRALQMALFPIAILTVFLNREIGFGLTEIMLLQAVFGLAMVVFEFPSGYLADRIGYRRCMILASALWMVAWPIYGTAEGWIGVVLAELLLGVGMALVSGCDTALLYETLLAQGRADQYMRFAGRITFVGQLAEGLAALAAGLLFAAAVALPFFAQSIASGLALLAALLLVEPERERPGFGDSLGQIRAMVRHVAREDPELRSVFAASIVLGLASFVPVWTIQLYALDAGLLEPWLGPVWAAANFTVAIAALSSHRLFGGRPIVWVVGLGFVAIVIGYLGLGLSHAIWGVGFYYVLMIMRGLQQPALGHREQELVPSLDRAGFVSLRSMVFRTGFLVIGPLVGLAVDDHGHHTPMLALALGFGLAAALVTVVVHRARAPGQVVVGTETET